MFYGFITILALLFTFPAVAQVTGLNPKFLKCSSQYKTWDTGIYPYNSPSNVTANIGHFDNMRQCLSIAHDRNRNPYYVTSGAIYYSSSPGNSDSFIRMVKPDMKYISKYYADVRKNCFDGDCAFYPPLSEISLEDYQVDLWIKRNKIIKIVFSPLPYSDAKQIIIENNPDTHVKQISVLDGAPAQSSLKYKKDNLLVTGKVQDNPVGVGLMFPQITVTRLLHKVVRSSVMTLTCASTKSQNKLISTLEFDVVPYLIDKTLFSVKLNLMLNDKAVIKDKTVTDAYEPDGTLEIIDYLKQLRPKALETENDWALDTALDCLRHTAWATSVSPNAEVKSEDFYDAIGIAEQLESLDSSKIKEPKQKKK